MKKAKMLGVYCFLTGVAVVVILLICTTFQTDQVQIEKDKVKPFNTGWVLTTNNGSQQVIILPANVKSGVQKNKTAILQNTLPTDLKSGMTLSFPTYHATVQVFVEHNMIYQFGIDNRYLFGKSPASTAWHFVNLPDDAQGKQITLKFCSPYQEDAGIFNSISIGTKSANVTDMVRQFLPSTIISCLVLILGIELLLVYVIAPKKTKRNVGLLYQGLFTIGISLSALMETSMLQLVSGNVLVLGYIMYFSLMLCPIPYLLFAKTVYDRHHARLYDFLCMAAAANFAISTFLQVSDLRDFHDTVSATHLVIVLGLLLSLYSACENLLKYHDKTVKPFLFGVMFMLLFYIIDTVRYYSGTYKDGALFCRIGLLIFIVILTIDAISRSFSMMELGMEARVLERLAYMDILTQKSNRTAFEKEMNALNTLEEMKSVAIVAFDLNNLKLINDNLGHTMGDKLIIGAADNIDASFGACGHCFRIGGDEFVILIKKYDKEKLKLCFDRFEQHIQNYDEKNQNKLEIAYGWSRYESGDHTIFEILSRADERMYIQKRKMKSVVSIANQSDIDLENKDNPVMV